MASRSEFDFDRWLRLARSDPERFEAQRREAIERLIDEAPQKCRRRLRGLQFRVDMERRRAPNPLAACVRLSQMMLEHFHGEFLPAFIGTGAPRPCTRPATPARVIPMQRKRPEPRA